MTRHGLTEFIYRLEKEGELKRISSFVNPLLEITEFADRAVSSDGKALLFENNGTGFPVLINAFGSEKRLAMALGKENTDVLPYDFVKLLSLTDSRNGNLFRNLSHLSTLAGLARIMPTRRKTRGRCQQIISNDPDLEILPVLKCWPHDGGRYITLPVVHTYHPETGKTNAGMYRMQILDSKTTAMHWQIHKTGANHFNAWKKACKRMPVSVTLGGDPVYTYAATAPLPENIDEYLFAGYLTGRKVKLVKCITNDIYVPEDADIVIEGYVDPSEPFVSEGPFGDHTGFYSLADYYPVFHVTCITYAKDAVYPATIVGIPPKEDLFLALATEKIFLMPVKTAICPEITDMHMPPAGVAHNLVIVSILKNYPGEGMKVINALFGAGQMMLTKYMVVVSHGTDIRNYESVLKAVLENSSFRNDIIFTSGPIDALDHSCEIPSFGGKMGIDATVKLPSEPPTGIKVCMEKMPDCIASLQKLQDEGIIVSFQVPVAITTLPVLIAAVRRIEGITDIEKLAARLRELKIGNFFRLVLAVDEEVDTGDLHMVAWQVLGNSDPVRDHYYISNKMA